MSYMEEILEYNKRFVENQKYELYTTSKIPDKKIVILSCMDTRLTELLLAALNLKNGDVQIIKNAGAVISSPFGSVMRSLLISIYDLEVEEIMVIGHYDCGMQELEPSKFIQKMLDRNIQQEKIDMVGYYGVDIYKWLRGFESASASVSETVNTIKKHPLIPADIKVSGFVMDPRTGKLDKVQTVQ